MTGFLRVLQAAHAPPDDGLASAIVPVNPPEKDKNKGFRGLNMTSEALVLLISQAE